MKLLGIEGKKGTALPGIVAYRNHIVKIYALVLHYIVGGLGRNVDAVFLHGGNGSGIHTVRFNSCTVHFGFVSGEITQISFGHLTATAIACAENENFFHSISEYASYFFTMQYTN